MELPAALDQLLPQQVALSRSNSGSTQAAALGISPALSGGADGDAEPQQQPLGPAPSASEQQPVLVNMTRPLMARMLQQCPDAAVRQQLYEDVLQPKLQQASRLLAQLAR